MLPFLVLGLLILMLSFALILKPTSTGPSPQSPQAFRWRLQPNSFIVKETAHDDTEIVLVRAGSQFQASQTSQSALPSSSDLWANDTTTIFDQGAWGSCTAYAMLYALAIYAKTNAYPEKLSAAYLYAMSRRFHGLSVTQDSGSSNAGTVQIVRTQGVVPESAFPYWASNIFKVPVGLTPQSTLSFTQFKFSAVPATTLIAMKSILVTRPLIVAVSMYNSFLSLQVMITGTIPMPSKADLRKGTVGGHAICLTGYNDATRRFSFRNSWGSDVGLAGLFTLPYDFFTANTKGRMSYVFDAWYY